MKILIGIDDTDNIGTAGTGYLADIIRTDIKVFGDVSFISRHQLYVHEDVPYTSHNSSMCFEADIQENKLNEVIELAAQHLKEKSAEGSDPGLCVAVKDKIPDPAALIGFGKAAKCSLLTKEMAYQMAEKQNLHLSEHGGTGQGVVGALAGVALRLYGNDGRVKGKIQVGEGGEIIDAISLKKMTGFENIVCIDGAEVKDDVRIKLSEGLIKAVLLSWRSTIIVSRDREGYKTLTKEQLKCF